MTVQIKYNIKKSACFPGRFFIDQNRSNWLDSTTKSKKNQRRVSISIPQSHWHTMQTKIKKKNNKEESIPPAPATSLIGKGTQGGFGLLSHWAFKFSFASILFSGLQLSIITSYLK